MRELLLLSPTWKIEGRVQGEPET
ncbi:hypothetical protein PhCBS80983_g00887 [Powellomyces hirtus]|uniref:Uncharacterized protein n=1 Tax=Powellomyces hirtus TaxID=109895 RepID=A0A507EF24_9FUNG|nr:hypothetical protein PhCBS80983_g00887 [Powellomyces hirtus]